MQQSKYHGCQCPGSLRRQDISTHGIDYVEYESSYIRNDFNFLCLVSVEEWYEL